jgi:radical SAM protein with 4Fe4S-binding SPASM domain
MSMGHAAIAATRVIATPATFAAEPAMESAIVTARVPDKLTILITHRCNQSCEFCFDASNVLCASNLEDMNLETLDAVLTSLKASVTNPEAFNITLSGGEPTIHPRFIDMVARVSDAGFPVTILTNGQRFANERFLDAVLKYNIWNLQFSIEGASAAVHDSRVGCHGAFNRLVRAIESARDRGVRFITNSTMTGTSIDEMFRLIDFLEELGILKMNIGNTLPECAARNWNVMMQYPEVVELAERLTLYALTKRIAFSFITPLPLCLKEGRQISNPSVCSAGRYSLVIEPDGRIKPCSVCAGFEDELPSVFELGVFNDVYSRMEALVMRFVTDGIPKECRTCSRFFECKGACPLYWKASGVTAPLRWESTGQGEMCGPREQ